LRELLGEVELRELLDPEVLAEVEAELQSLARDRQARSADGLHDLLRRVGDLDLAELAARCAIDTAPLIETLERTGRAVPLRLGRPATARWVAVEDVARYRDALGAQPPSGLPSVYLEAAPNATESLVARYARVHGPFTLDQIATRFGMTSAQLAPAVRLLVLRGRLLEGAYRPGGLGVELCDPEVLRRLRRQTLARLRKAVAPVDASVLARFLPAWHGIGSTRGDTARLREVLYTLEGLALPFGELEGRVLPARIAGYHPRLLDELGAAGEIVWLGRGAIGNDDGRVAVYYREHVDRLADAPAPPPSSPLHDAIVACLAQRGAAFFAQLQAACPTALAHELEAALWDLVWAGQVTNDTFAPLRALGRARRGPSVSKRPGAARLSPTLAGRWSRTAELLRDTIDPTQAAHARVLCLLERHGVLTRESLQHENVVGGFAALTPVLRAMEDAGRVRRGYFIEGLSGSQYALPGAVDRLRDAAADADPRVVVVPAIDPANPYGALIDWPKIVGDSAEDAGRARRVAGALVVIVDGHAALFLERGGRTLLLFEQPPDTADSTPRAVTALRATVGERSVRITEVNGRPALRSIHAGALERAGLRMEPGGLVLRGPGSSA
jgi:ATP-dependent Lhr-like helicase